MLNKREVEKKIQSLISEFPIVLFMKGNRENPQCGFSAEIVKILDHYVPFYETCDVLLDPDLREGIKEFSEWPTIPQLYVRKQFIGGCDIMKELHQAGALIKILGLKLTGLQVPKVSLSDSAYERCLYFLRVSYIYHAVRISVSARYAYSLQVDDLRLGDMELKYKKIQLIFSKPTASRIDGMRIEFVESEMKRGFKFINPSFPSRVKLIKVSDLKALVIKEKRFTIFDTRTQNEWDDSNIQNSKLLLGLSRNDMERISKNESIIFYCNKGKHSRAIAEKFRFNGFSNVYSLIGGIEEWNKEKKPDSIR